MKELWKAINNLNNKITRIQDILNSRFGIRCDENANNIQTLDDAITELSEITSDMNVALNDIAEFMSDVELAESEE